MRPHRIVTVVTMLLAVGNLAAASHPADRSPAIMHASDVSPAARSFPGAVPATFAGDLPCADCPGVRHTLELHADGTFVYRLTYLGRGEGGKGDSFDDIGRWSVSDDGRTLTLEGGREAPVKFAVADPNTLRKLDLSGQPIQSALNYDLARVSGASPLEPRLLVRGMYSYMADAAVFVECSTGWRLPVATEADNVALERGYLEAQPKPGEPLLVSLEGLIAMRPAMEGAGQQRSLVPVKFVKTWPGERCQPTEGGKEMPTLDGTAWQLTSGSLRVPSPDPKRVTLKFTGTRVSASSGCNTGTGNYSVEANALIAGALAATRKGCPDPLAAWEAAFFEFLGSKPAMARERDELVLTSGEHSLRFRSVPVPSARAVKRFIYVAAERKPCSGVGRFDCLQVREQPCDPWRLHHGEIVGFTHVPGTEYRLRILEDEVPNPPGDGTSKRWFLDLVVEQRVIE